MERYEITGGNGNHATLDQIASAIVWAGGLRVNRRRAYGWKNQPLVVTFAAKDWPESRAICDAAAQHLWQGDGSCGATLHAYKYTGIKNG